MSGNGNFTTQEIMAMDAFLAEHWEKFTETARNYLSDEEIEALAGKLASA